MSKSVQREINCFGYALPFYRSSFNEIEPYQFEKGTSDTYVRFDATTGDCPIIKIHKNGNEYTQTWAYGKWSERNSLSYDKAINELRTVTREEEE